MIQTPEQQIFNLQSRFIANITQSFPALVTTTVPHGYNDGLNVLIVLPRVYGTSVVTGVRYQGFGMEQINRQQGVIRNTDDPTVFQLSIDTRNFDPFVFPPNQNIPDAQVQYPQVIPVGGTEIANAFIDILII